MSVTTSLSIRLLFHLCGGDVVKLVCLKQHQIDLLLARGVLATAIIHPTPIHTCRGERAKDGRFDESPEGIEWLAFEEQHGLVFWNQHSGEIATDTSRAFALGEELIDNPATTAFDQHLNIYDNPMEWLLNGRRGIVVVKWELAFDRLRDVASVAVAETVLATYRRHMRPQHIPKLYVLPKVEGKAA